MFTQYLFPPLPLSSPMAEVRSSSLKLSPKLPAHLPHNHRRNVPTTQWSSHRCVCIPPTSLPLPQWQINPYCLSGSDPDYSTHFTTTHTLSVFFNLNRINSPHALDSAMFLCLFAHEASSGWNLHPKVHPGPIFILWRPAPIWFFWSLPQLTSKLLCLFYL